MPTLTLPGPNRRLERYTTQAPSPLPPARPPFNRVAYAAVHVVADPLADADPWGTPAIDWDATLDYRQYLWSLGLGVAEATGAAQRGAGLDWPASLELIRRSVAAAPAGAALVCGAGTDHLPPGTGLAPNLSQIAGAYAAQCDSIERLGGRIVLLPSAALAAARGPDDVALVFARLLPQLRQPAILQWPADVFGHDLALALATDHAAKLDGIAPTGLAPADEAELRRRLPRGVRLYTGDEQNFPDSLAGDDDGYAHAMLAVLGPAAPAAAAALAALQQDRTLDFGRILAPAVPLARHLFRPPAIHYPTGLVFMAYLNGHQSHFSMLAGRQSARALPHLAELFRLADAAGLLRDPDDACARMARFLAVHGVA